MHFPHSDPHLFLPSVKVGSSKFLPFVLPPFLYSFVSFPSFFLLSFIISLFSYSNSYLSHYYFILFSFPVLSHFNFFIKLYLAS